MHTVATNNAAPVIAAGPVGPSRRRRRVHAPLTRRRQPSSSAVLLVAAFGAFLAFLDSTIVNVAFPDIQRHFHSDISDLSWMLNAYNIVFAAFLVAAGRLADLMGRKRVFILGVALFTVASGLCAIAESVGELVAFRVLQGIGAAVLVPASLGLVVEAFPAERRAHGVNLWGAAGAIAAGLGPPIGGALIEADGWRWVFLVNLPLGVFAVLAARRALVENRAAGRRRVPDVRGAVLLAFALGLLTLGLIKGPDWGWASLPTSGSLLAAAVAMVGFVMSSRHHPAPMVEPTLLRIQSFVAGTGLTAVASAGFYAYLLTHVLFLNYVWGYTLLEAGMAVAPAALVAAVVAAVLGRVADRHGYRFIVGIGALIWAASLLWYLKVVGSQPDFLGEWLPGQILQGIGVGATFPLLGSAALARLAKGGSYATASAVTGTIRQVGAVIGVAVLVILVGTPAPGAAEEALRHGWALAAICFVAVGIGALSLGRIRPVPAAVEPPPGPPVAPLGARRPPRPAPVEFAKIADAGVLGALAGVLAKRQHQTRVASQRTTPEVVVAVVGVDANAPVAMVATELCRALSTRLRAVAPGRVDCDGLERAEQTADRVVLHAAVGDARWREFCLRVADRVVLVASNPAVPVAPLPTRATGADLVLAGRPAGREHRRAWEQLITPRSMHVVRREFVADDLRVLATRIAGRSVGLVLSGGAARACAHLGVLEELEAAGVTVDRFAGTSMGAIIAALAASGLDAAGVDAQIYEHFVRKSHGDYTLPSKGLIRGKRTQSTLRTIFGDHLVEELPKHFRCVSVDLLARRPVVHRQGPLADVVGCSMRLPFLYAPLPYGGTLHVDGGVLDNVPVTTLVGKDGPLIAVNVASGGNPSPASGGHRRGKPRVPGLTDTLLRTMTISSAMASEKVLAQADLVIKPNPIGVGLMEYHQIDRAREAGRIAAREALPQIMELVHG